MISIIIPNWNGEKFLENCIGSLLKQTYKNFEVILVDNFSQDESVNIFQKGFENTNFKNKIIKLDKNYGFSKAVNEGIKISQGYYVFLLNNDTELDKDCIKYFVKFIEESDDKFFSASAKMMKYHDREMIDDAGDMYTILGWGYQRGHGKLISCYEKDVEVFSACAGAAIYKREIFNEIGYFDENHFAYLEDMDIGYRAKLCGYKNYFCSDALVYHIGSGSSGGKYNDFKVKLSARNNIYLIYKNMPLVQLIINLPFLILGFLIKFIFFLTKDLKYGKLYILGLMEGLKDCFSGDKLSKFKEVKLSRILVIELELILNFIKYFFSKIIK